MTRPTGPGWWWAAWQSKALGTADINDAPSGLPEIVEVIENCLDETDDEYLGVFVGGVERMQWLENFEWLRPVDDVSPCLDNLFINPTGGDDDHS